MPLDLYGAPVNNAGVDPMQGFDFECWAIDSVGGGLAFFGRFQSLTLSIRDTTETYLELGQRIPIYLNGEIQIAWVLEKGMVDMAFIARTFGITDIRRDRIVSRGPRFHIAFDANAHYRLNQTSEGKVTDPVNLRQGATNERDLAFGLGDPGPSGGLPKFRDVTTASSNNPNLPTTPTNTGRYELMRCKVDSVSLGLMPGRMVAAVRWEGVSEGITYVTKTAQGGTFYNP